MEYLRPIDWEKASARFEGGYRGQFLWYSESCAVIATRIPPGVSGPPRHTHTSDQIYFLVDGELEIDLGTDTVTAPQHSGVLIPAGTPH